MPNLLGSSSSAHLIDCGCGLSTLLLNELYTEALKRSTSNCNCTLDIIIIIIIIARSLTVVLLCVTLTALT